MSRLVVVIASIAALLAAAPPAAEPGGAFGIGRHHAPVGPSAFPFGSRPGGPHSGLQSVPLHRGVPSQRRPFARHAPRPVVGGVIAAEPGHVHVVGVPVPQFEMHQTPVTPAAEPEVPDPKFVFPPPANVEAPPGFRTVTVQRGSRVETTTLPIDR